jgi:hypothetical protein
MARFYRCCILGLIGVSAMGLALGIGAWWGLAPTPKDEVAARVEGKNDVNCLTEDEAEPIMDISEIHGLWTHMDADGHIEVVVPTPVRELHVKKRLQLLGWLLGIVQRGSARDALICAGWFIALEDNASCAIMCVYYPRDNLDNAWPGVDSMRSTLAVELNKLLAKATKEEEQRRGKL